MITRRRHDRKHVVQSARTLELAVQTIVRVRRLGNYHSCYGAFGFLFSVSVFTLSPLYRYTYHERYRSIRVRRGWKKNNFSDRLFHDAFRTAARYQDVITRRNQSRTRTIRSVNNIFTVLKL